MDLESFVIEEPHRGKDNIALENLENIGIERGESKADDDCENKDDQFKAKQLGSGFVIFERVYMQDRIENQRTDDHEREGWNHGGHKEIAAQFFDIARERLHRGFQGL